MRQWWDNLNEGERRAVMIVAPIVALALIVAALRGRQRAAEQAAAADKSTTEQITDTTPGGIIPGGYTGGGQPGDAVGVDQLAQFESMFTNALGEAFGAIDALGSGLQGQFGTLTSDLEGQIDVISSQVEDLSVASQSPQADPDDPPAVSTRTQTARRPRPGWDLVRDNLGAYFVVEWSSKRRFRVQARDVERAKATFGTVVSKLSQVPSAIRQETYQFLDRLRREEGDRLDRSKVYLDQRMGWQPSGTWSNQGTR